MAKIFQSIAFRTTTNGVTSTNQMSKIYSDSTPNNDRTTFIELRKATEPINPYTDITRIKEVYNIYQTTTSGSISFTRNKLRQTATHIKRGRAKTLYEEFPAVNPLITNKNTPFNGALVEIKPGGIVNLDTESNNVNAEARRNQGLNQSFFSDFLQNAITKALGRTGNSPQPTPYLNALETNIMIGDTQTRPNISGKRDYYRIVKYLATPSGFNFINRQAELQSRNTFGQTRNYSAGSVTSTVGERFDINNPIPSALVVKLYERFQSNDFTTKTELMGRLQENTVVDTQRRVGIKLAGNVKPRSGESAPTEPASPVQSPSLTTRLGTDIAQRWLAGVYNRNVGNQRIPIPGVVQKATNWINNRFGTRLTAGNEIRVSQIANALIGLGQISVAFERKIVTDPSTMLRPDQTAYDEMYVKNLWPLMKERNDSGGNLRTHQLEKERYLLQAQDAIGKLKGKSINRVNKFTEDYNVDPKNDYRSATDYTDAVRSATATTAFNGITTAKYIKDDFNLTSARTPITTVDQLDGKDENGDYVTVKFSVPGVFSKGITFRAFLDDFNHSAKGQYEEIRYVGRPERFVNYRGMNRSTTFSLYLIAFSSDELSGVWTRANMLNKLVYPIDNPEGYMKPPLVNLTIGKILIDQPGYVENIDMRFQEVPWDITHELPMSVKLNLTFNIIEKDYITQKDKKTNLFGLPILDQPPDVDLSRANANTVEETKKAAAAVQTGAQKDPKLDSETFKWDPDPFSKPTPIDFIPTPEQLAKEINEMTIANPAEDIKRWQASLARNSGGRRSASTQTKAGTSRFSPLPKIVPCVPAGFERPYIQTVQAELRNIKATNWLPFGR